jgi:hypothetical protein
MSSSKRHFTTVIGKKEQGTYTSSSPSSAARKAVSKLCADDKNRKVEFYMRETTQASIKKVYGPYMGYIEKLKKPIELKGRVIRYKPIAKLLKNNKMSGGNFRVYNYWYKDTSKGRTYKSRLIEKFEGIYTPVQHQPGNNSFRHAVTYNNINKSQKAMSGKFLINEGGIQIADNFPNFEQIHPEIIKAFIDLNIEIDHNPEENIEEINE